MDDHNFFLLKYTEQEWDIYPLLYARTIIIPIHSTETIVAMSVAITNLMVLSIAGVNGPLRLGYIYLCVCIFLFFVMNDMTEITLTYFLTLLSCLFAVNGTQVPLTKFIEYASASERDLL